MNNNPIEQTINISADISVRDLTISIHKEGDRGHSAIINELGRVMRTTYKAPERYETQLCCVSHLLNADGKYLIKELNEFIKLQEEKIS